MANAVTTVRAREKMVKARAGDLTLPKIVSMAFGDGGIDANGNLAIPLDTANALTHETLRKSIDSHTYPSTTTCTYTVTIGKAEIPNTNVNEIALVDADGDLVAIKTFGNKFKDADMEMTFSIDDEF